MQRNVFDLFKKILMDIDGSEQQVRRGKLSLKKCLLFILVSVLMVFPIAVSSPLEFITFASVLIAFIIPGILIIRKLFWNNIFQNPEGIFFGSALGLGLSSLLIAIVGYFITWSFFPLIAILILFSLTIYYLLKKYKSEPIQINVSKWTKEDFWILFSFIIVSIISLIPVYLNIGKLTSHGIAFTSLIGNDFVAHLNHAASLSHGIPPQYFHFAGETLRYYWLSFILPSLVYSFPSEQFVLKDIMILNQLFLSVIFWGNLFCIVKLFTKNRKVAILVMLLAFCAYSYNDFYVLLKYLAGRFASNPIIEIMKSEGLLTFSDLSHGFFRFYVFESQTLLGLSLLLLSLFLLVNYSGESAGKNVILGIVGIITGLTLGVEVLTGMLLASVLMIFILVEVVSLYKKNGFDLKGVYYLLQPVILAFMIYSIYFVIQMFSFAYGNESLIFKLNKPILLGFPAYLLLEYGPLSIFGALGVYKMITAKNMTKKHYPVLALLVFSLFIVLFVDAKESLAVNMGAVKGGRTIFLSLLLFSSFFIEDIISRKKSRLLTVSCFALIVIASPTLLIDIQTLSDVNDTKNTRYVESEDYLASEWLKANTPKDSIVQAFSDRSAYSIATFGERKMALGWSMAYRILHDNIKSVPERLMDTEQIFRSSNIDKVNELIKKYDIGYIYIGPHDRSRMGKGDWKKFERYQDLFQNVYSRKGVEIYRIRK